MQVQIMSRMTRSNDWKLNSADILFAVQTSITTIFNAAMLASLGNDDVPKWKDTFLGQVCIGLQLACLENST